jgi:hypothetical protein
LGCIVCRVWDLPGLEELPVVPPALLAVKFVLEA